MQVGLVVALFPLLQTATGCRVGEKVLALWPDDGSWKEVEIREVIPSGGCSNTIYRIVWLTSSICSNVVGGSDALLAKRCKKNRDSLKGGSCDSIKCTSKKKKKTEDEEKKEKKRGFPILLALLVAGSAVFFGICAFGLWYFIVKDCLGGGDEDEEDGEKPIRPHKVAPQSLWSEPRRSSGNLKQISPQPDVEEDGTTHNQKVYVEGEHHHHHHHHHHRRSQNSQAQIGASGAGHHHHRSSSDGSGEDGHRTTHHHHHRSSSDPSGEDGHRNAHHHHHHHRSSADLSGENDSATNENGHHEHKHHHRNSHSNQPDVTAPPPPDTPPAYMPQGHRASHRRSIQRPSIQRRGSSDEALQATLNMAKGSKKSLRKSDTVTWDMEVRVRASVANASSGVHPDDFLHHHNHHYPSPPPDVTAPSQPDTSSAGGSGLQRSSSLPLQLVQYSKGSQQFEQPYDKSMGA